MGKFIKTAILLFAVFGLCQVTPLSAQKKKKNKNHVELNGGKKDKGIKSVADLTKNCRKYNGLFTIYQDTINGKSYLEVREDQLNMDFIYFSHIVDGILDAGFFRGAYRGSKIINFNKHYERLEIMTENTSYYFDENNALHRAATANINQPIIISEKIEAGDTEKGVYLISGDNVFLSEKFQMVKPPSRPGRKGLLGSLSKDKTQINSINNYPENTEVRVTYVYENKNPQTGGSKALTDLRNISIVYQHSLLAMPDNDFQSRQDDERVGYFMTQVDDMTSFSATPYRDMIHRWDLVKKNPEMEISEPVEPITYWIENTTPVEFRPIIKQGVERWNIAFEKAGFKNAVVVKIQPDDAIWDAGDIRYNVLRWTSSPRPPFGGYGPSFVNPRTGQILGADIMLEFSAITNRLFRSDVFEIAGYQTDEDFERMEDVNDILYCSAGNNLHHTLMFGLHSMRAMNVNKAAQEEFVKQGIYRLVLHEVGHTLGLMHNMRASTMQSIEELKNKKVVDQEGLCNSVMEYPAVNFPSKPEEQTLFYDVKPGPYDIWAIEYAYSPSLEDEVAEQRRLEKILSRSSEPDLMFGNDADDMRSSGKGIDPDVNIYDLSSDPVGFAVERCELVNTILPKIKDEYVNESESYQEFKNAYFVLTGEYGTQIRVMTRQIGGVHYDRSHPYQKSGNTPYTPVSEENQKAAMKALSDYAFAPNAFDIPHDIYNYLQHQRRGFNNFSENEDPHILSRVLRMQRECLNQLLHRNVAQRILDSEMYGNTYTLDEVMTDLTNAIFIADLKKEVTNIRQNLQIEYVEQLAKMIDEKSKHDNITQSMVIYEMNRIKKNMKTALSPNTLTRAHRQHIIKIIDDALEA